jgi:hypothetical protein
VGNLADFQGATFNDRVTFESGIVERDTYFSDAIFKGETNFNYFKSERFMDFVGTTFQEKFLFTYTEIGWPYFKDAVWNNEVDFEGMHATSDFELTDASYNFPGKPFQVYLAEVDGRTLFTGFRSGAGLKLTHNQFSDLEITGRDDQTFDVIDLSSTVVTGDLSMGSLTTNELNMNGSTIGDSTTIQNVKVNNKLDMSNTSIGIFNMDNFLWPNDPDSFNLRGMTYSDIGLVKNSKDELVDLELNERNWTILKDMVEQSAYSPQAYRTLSQFLTEKGHPDWAADVELARKERERNQILKPPPYGPWLWSWFLYIFSGYGQRPQFAFAWSALVIFIGTLVFRREEDMVVLEGHHARPPYNPFLYSFALFLPYIDLEIASKWDPKPDRIFATHYKHVHRLLGWILMPIALLTFGGIIG